MYQSNQARRIYRSIRVGADPFYHCTCGPTAAYWLADARLLGLGPHPDLGS